MPDLPIANDKAMTKFRRLVIGQDTGSAIVGPARADIYFGAGMDAGKVSGRLRHNMRFVILIPRSLDPVARGRAMPLPEVRPSAKIAKLFPQTDPLKKDAKAEAPAAIAQAAQPVPLPEARPEIRTDRHARRHRYHSRYRYAR